MAVTTTTAAAVRETLINKIRRINPRASENRAERWKWVGNRQRVEVTGRTLRQFDVILGVETEQPGGWYGEGVEYAAPCTIRVGYPKIAEEMARLAGADGQDLSALLVAIHYDLDGLFPVSTAAKLLDYRLHVDAENGYVLDFVVVPGLHFFASDIVALHPE